MASSPSAHVETLDGEATAILREPATGSEAQIVVGVGSNLARFRTSLAGRDTEVISAPPDIETLRQRPTRWGTGVLFPYPGRIRHGRFTFEGNTVELPRDPRDGNAIHGVVRSRAWKIVSLASDTVRGASVTTSIDTASAAIPASEWPFPFRLTLGFSLLHRTVRIDCTVENIGRVAMPFGLGFHPYFPTPLGPAGSADDCFVWADAEEVWDLGPDSIPSGTSRPLTRGDAWLRGRRLGDLPFMAPISDPPVRNVVLMRKPGASAAGHDGIATGIHDRANNVAVTMRSGGAFPGLVLFTPGIPSVISLEPHTCLPNAFNLANEGVPTTGMQVLQAGAIWRSWWAIGATVARPTQPRADRRL